MNFLPVRGISPFHENPSQECLGEWCCSKQRIVIYRSGKKALWATVEDKLGNITRVPPEHIHGGMNRELSSRKLIQMMKELPKRRLTLVLSHLPNLEIELHVFLTLQAAGHDEEKQLEYARKLIENARSCDQYQEAVDLYRDALDRFRSAILELDKGKEDFSAIKRELQQIEKEFFHYQLDAFIRDYLYFPNDQKEFTKRLSVNSNSKNLLDDLLCLAKRTSIRPPSICDHFTCAYIVEIRGGKLLSAEHYLMLAEAYSKVSQFSASFCCLHRAISLVKSLNNAFITAHFFEHIDRKWLKKLCERIANRECEQWFLEKDAVRMTFESHLVSLKTLSKRQRPTCFVCFSLEEDVRQWLLKALLRDLHLLGVKPLCSSTDLNPGRRLEAFQDFIKYAEKVIIICTPELQRKCKERGMDRDGGCACEIALILPRCYGAQKLDEKGIIPLFLKGDRKSSLPVNFLEDIFGTKLNDRDPGILAYNEENQEIGILSYYENAFRLFGSILDIDPGASGMIKRKFSAALEDIWRGNIDQEEVKKWRIRRRRFEVPLDQISLEEAVLHTSSSIEIVTRLLNTFKVRLEHNPTMVQALEYYVDLNATTAYRGNQLEDLGDRLKRFLEGTKTFMLIQGDTGSGKSTFVHRSTKNLLETYLLSTSGVVPLLIELKEMSLKSQKFHGNFLERFLKERVGLTDKEIALLKMMPTVIFFDGFDEMSVEPSNLFRMNDLDRWHCKVVVTCRHQFLLNRDYHSWFCLHHEFYRECDELFISPFSQDQIRLYLKKFKPSLLQYQNAINQYIPKELMENPLLLRMVVEVFPRINLARKVTRYEIYEETMDGWFDREDSRLNRLHGSSTKLKGLPPKNAFFKFSMRLAMQMCREGTLELEYSQPQQAEDEFNLGLPLRNREDDKKCEAFFSDTDEEIVKTREGCLLICSNRRYSFYHKSLWEFFVAAYIQKTLHMDTKDPRVQERVVQVVAQLPFNTAYLSSEPGIIKFLSEHVVETRESIKLLTDIVLASKNRPELSRAASNAVTIMNMAGVSFANHDFSFVQIPRANLERSNFDHSNLSGANLSHVNFRKAWIREADLTEATMKDVDFGEILINLSNQPVRALISSLENTDQIVIACGSEITIYDTLNKCVLKRLPKLSQDIVCLANNPANPRELASGCADGSVYIWDYSEGKIKHVFKHARKEILCLAYRPNGNQIAVGGSNGEVTIFNLSSWKIECVLIDKETTRTHTNKEQVFEDVMSLTYSSDGRFLVTGSSIGYVRVWHSDLLSLTSKRELNKKGIQCVVSDPKSDRIFIGDSDKKVTIVSLNSFELKKEFDVESSIDSLIYSSKKNTLIIGSRDGSIYSLDLMNGASPYLVGWYPGRLLCLAYCFDENYVVCGTDSASLFFERVNEKRESLSMDSRQKRLHYAKINCFSFNNELQQLISGGADSILCQWNPEKQTILNSIKFDRSITAFCYNPRQTILAIGLSSGVVHLLDTYLFKELCTFVASPTKIVSLSWSLDGDLVIGAGSHIVSTWSWHSKQVIKRLIFDKLSQFSNSLICLHGNKLAHITLEGHILIKDTLEGNLFESLGNFWDSDFNLLQFSGNGSYLVAATNHHGTFLWKLKEPRSMQILRGPKEKVSCISFNGEESLIACGDTSRAVWIWKIATEELVAKLDVQTSPTSIAFVGQEKLVVGCADGEIYFFECETARKHWFLVNKNIQQRYLTATRTKLSTPSDISKENLNLLQQRGAIIINAIHARL